MSWLEEEEATFATAAHKRATAWSAWRIAAAYTEPGGNCWKK
jgi:hypothetical protein